VIRERIGAGDSVYRISDAPAHMGDRTVRQRDAIDGRGPKRKAMQAASPGDLRAPTPGGRRSDQWRQGRALRCRSMPPFCPSLRILRASISMGSAVNGAPTYGMARPMAHARAAEASAGVTNNPPRSFVSGDELTYPTRTGSTCRDSNSRARSKSGAVGTTQTSTLETEFCGPMSLRDAGMNLADRLVLSQVAEMSSYSAD
jgi:hypothetical protein